MLVKLLGPFLNDLEHNRHSRDLAGLRRERCSASDAVHSLRETRRCLPHNVSRQPPDGPRASRGSGDNAEAFSLFPEGPPPRPLE
jgi:hypothetical protein